MILNHSKITKTEKIPTVQFDASTVYIEHSRDCAVFVILL